MTPGIRKRVETVFATVALFRQGSPDMVFYTAEDAHGSTMLCATISDLTAQLRQTLWQRERPVILTSATLAVGEDFHRFKEEIGLLTDSRVTESVSPSPFDYQKNCLLYLPRTPPHQEDKAYYDKLVEEIAALLEAAQGHALALFTSYAAMSAVKERLQGKGVAYPLFTTAPPPAQTAVMPTIIHAVPRLSGSAAISASGVCSGIACGVGSSVVSGAVSVSGASSTSSLATAGIGAGIGSSCGISTPPKMAV